MTKESRRRSPKIKELKQGHQELADASQRYMSFRLSPEYRNDSRNEQDAPSTAITSKISIGDERWTESKEPDPRSRNSQPPKGRATKSSSNETNKAQHTKTKEKERTWTCNQNQKEKTKKKKNKSRQWMRCCHPQATLREAIRTRSRNLPSKMEAPPQKPRSCRCRRCHKGRNHRHLEKNNRSLTTVGELGC
ncbi:hypothetical protein V6N13_126657 [Hibiscus sabdariffa]